jgi:hypothetical protein
MRYLRQQALNRRAPQDQRLYVDMTDSIVMTTTNNLLIPKGTGDSAYSAGTTQNQRPVSPVNGMMRYNTTLEEIEVYQSNNWRSLRFKEPTLITQQSLGAGDGTNLYFGPLSPAPVTLVQSGVTWDLTQIAKNVLVVVENVLQLAVTNYTVVQNPTVPAETYTPKLSFAAVSGATTLYFNSHVLGTGASWLSTEATLTFTTLTQTPFAVGSSIIVTGYMPTAYNGTFTVTSSTVSSVSFTLASNPGTTTVVGQIKSADAIYTSVDITGATINGHANIQSSTTIVSAVSDPNTDALISVVINQPTITGTIAINTQLTIAESITTPTGYYIKFGSPVPLGKMVTVLHGFDK